VFLGGACTGYIVIVGDITTPFLELLPGFGPDYDKQIWRIIVMATVAVVIMLPLSALKRMDSLRFTSMIAIVCIIYLVTVIMVRSCSYLRQQGVNTQDLYLFKFSVEIFTVLPIIGFAFTFHMQIFPIMIEMKDQKQIHPAINVSVIICSVCYLTVGIFGYLHFYKDTQDNILKNYLDADIVVDIGKVALFFIMCFSYPLLSYTARIVFDELAFKLQPTPRWRRWTESIVFVLITFIIAVVVPGIGFVFSFVGASAGNMVVYILPGYFYLWVLHEKEVQMGRWQRPEKWWQWLRWFELWKIPAVFTILFGIFITIISLTVILVDVA